MYKNIENQSKVSFTLSKPFHYYLSVGLQSLLKVCISMQKNVALGKDYTWIFDLNHIVAFIFTTIVRSTVNNSLWYEILNTQLITLKATYLNEIK